MTRVSDFTGRGRPRYVTTRVVTPGGGPILVGMRSTVTLEMLLLGLALASCSNDGGSTPSPPAPIDAVIFSRSDDVFLVKPDGSGLVPLANSAAAESYRGFLDGRLLIQRDTDIYSVLPDGTDLRPVVNSSEVEAYAGSLGNRVIYLLGPDIDQLKLAIVGLDGSNHTCSRRRRPGTRFRA
jgi:hypothetical protein